MHHPLTLWLLTNEGDLLGEVGGEESWPYPESRHVIITAMACYRAIQIAHFLFFLLSYNINFVFMFVGLAASARRHWLRILWRRFGRSSSDTTASIATSLPQSFIHCWIHIDGWLVRQPCPRRTSQTRQQSGRRDWRNCKWRCSTFGTRHSGPLGPVPEEYR